MPDPHAGLHPQVRALLVAEARLSAPSVPADLEAQRAAYLGAALAHGGPPVPVAELREVVLGGGLRARAYRPLVSVSEPGIVIWLHGGGWLLGSPDSHDGACRSIAAAAGHWVLSVDYRLAPEHPFPAAVEDAVAAVDWACGHGAAQLGADPARVAVGGDSAGGSLAVAAARRRRGHVRAQLLAYPALDPTLDSDAYRAFAHGPGLGRADMAACWRAYLGPRDPSDVADPDISPLLADDLAGVPPAYVGVAGQDCVRDDGLRYAAALRGAGVPVVEERFEDMAHGFLRWGGVVDRTQELVDGLAAAARRALARPRSVDPA